MFLNFNPRTPCGVRHDLLFSSQFLACISIHAPLAGCDSKVNHCLRLCVVISIHAPLAGCDGVQPEGKPAAEAFQSTHPLRGATVRVGGGVRGVDISIHAPLAGCDVLLQIVIVVEHAISIHAPLAGCDQRLTLVCGLHPYFNPRTPCGVRQRKCTRFSAHFCDNRQFYRVFPSGAPSVGALFTYFRGLKCAGAGANLPANGCALGLRAKASAGARLPSALRKRSSFKSRRSLPAPVRAAAPFRCNSRQQRTESCPDFSA